MTQPTTRVPQKSGTTPAPATAPKTKVTVTAPATAAKNKAPKPPVPSLLSAATNGQKQPVDWGELIPKPLKCSNKQPTTAPSAQPGLYQSDG